MPTCIWYTCMLFHFQNFLPAQNIDNFICIYNPYNKVAFFFIAINVSLNVLIVHIIWLFYRQVCFIFKGNVVSKLIIKFVHPCIHLYMIIAEILLKLALKTNQSIKLSCFIKEHKKIVFYGFSYMYIVRMIMIILSLVWFICHFQQYFSYIVEVSFIGGGKWNTCSKSLTNFIT